MDKAMHVGRNATITANMNCMDCEPELLRGVKVVITGRGGMAGDVSVKIVGETPESLAAKMLDNALCFCGDYSSQAEYEYALRTRATVSNARDLLACDALEFDNDDLTVEPVR